MRRQREALNDWTSIGMRLKRIPLLQEAVNLRSVPSLNDIPFEQDMRPTGIRRRYPDFDQVDT